MYREDRCMQLAFYVIKENATVRQAAQKFGIPKSTVYKAITEDLLEVSVETAIEVRKVLVRNKAERCMRGGEATKKKLEKLKRTK